MKKYLSLLLFATVLMNCSAEAQKVHVEGKADGRATKAYFVDLDSKSQDVIDSAQVVNSAFTAELPAKEGHLVGVVTNGGYSQMFFTEGAKVTVDVVNDVVTGSGLNEKYGKFFEQKKALAGKKDELKAMIAKVVAENKDNGVCVAVINMATDVLAVDEVLDLLPANSPLAGHPMLSQLYRMKEAMAQRMPGSPLKDIAIPDAEGKTHKLSDYVGKGKYVLIDFWASWCGPCCREMPNVVEAYAKYKDKGFEVIGVSLDNKKEAWLNKVKQLGMTWPQLSDLKGWECEAAALYGVRAIPSNVLFSPDGKILSTDLTGEVLQTTLAEIFKGK